MNKTFCQKPSFWESQSLTGLDHVTYRVPSSLNSCLELILFFSILLKDTQHFLNHIIFSLVILYQVFFPKDVEVSIGDVRVNGKMVAQSERGDHVEAIPRGMDPARTTSRRIKFKGLSKGFSKEVKLRRPSAQAKKWLILPTWASVITNK